MSAAAMLQDRCKQGVTALDRLLQEHPENLEKDIVEATRCLVRLRDELTSRMRDGVRDAAEERHLMHVNAVISVLMAGHYPIEGVRWDCIKHARDALSSA